MIADGLSHRVGLHVAHVWIVLVLVKVLVVAFVVVPSHQERIRHAEVHLVALELHSPEKVIACITCVHVVHKVVVHSREAWRQNRRRLYRLDRIYPSKLILVLFSSHLCIDLTLCLIHEVELIRLSLEPTSILVLVTLCITIKG